MYTRKSNRGHNFGQNQVFRIQIPEDFLKLIKLWQPLAPRCQRVRRQTKYLGLLESRAALISGVYLEFRARQTIRIGRATRTFFQIFQSGDVSNPSMGRFVQPQAVYQVCTEAVFAVV